MLFNLETKIRVTPNLFLAFLVFEGIYEKINCTTSDDWNEGHPFKDRRNISLFVSYASNRRCGFKIGRITFSSFLAWFSWESQLCCFASCNRINHSRYDVARRGSVSNVNGSSISPVVVRFLMLLNQKL